MLGRLLIATVAVFLVLAIPGLVLRLVRGQPGT